MKPFVLLLASGFLAADLFAVRHAAFETDVYNRAFPVTCRGDIVFSPLSAEIDLAVAAESLGTIERANVAESMGVLVEFAGVYRPLLERLSAGTNGFSFAMARGFCLPAVEKARTDYCARIQKDYGAEVMPLLPAEGARSWFRAAMDGQMEDFAIDDAAAVSDRYSFYDLVAIRAEWESPFPTAGIRRLSFATPEKTKVKLDFLTDVRMAETWEDREYDLIRLPLRGGYSFYALLPKPGIELARVREDFSSMEIEGLLAMVRTRSSAAGRYRREPTIVVIPRLEMDFATDFTATVQSCRVPTSALTALAGGVAANRFVQRVRFTLKEYGLRETPFADKPPEARLRVEVDTRRMIFNRPFLFFVLDEEASVIPVAGQFTGLAEPVSETAGAPAK